MSGFALCKSPSKIPTSRRETSSDGSQAEQSLRDLGALFSAEQMRLRTFFSPGASNSCTRFLRALSKNCGKE